MHFDVTIPVKVFFFNQGEAAQSVSKTWNSTGQTTDKNTKYDVYVANHDKSFNGSSAIVGIQSIAFEIKYDGHTLNRGRHVQQCDFFIKTVSYNENEQQAYIGF